MRQLHFIITLCLLFNVAKAQQSSFSYHVEGCASERISKSGESKFQKPATNWPSLDTIYIKGDSLIYNRSVDHLCCRKVKLTCDIKENRITIIEHWHGMACKCKCESTVEAVIRKLKPGKYQVLVLLTATDPLNDQATSGADTLFQKDLIVKE